MDLVVWQNWIAFGGVAVALTAIGVSVRALKAAETEARIAVRSFDESKKDEQHRRESKEKALRAGIVSVMHEAARWAEDVSAAVSDIPVNRRVEDQTTTIPTFPPEYVQSIMMVIEATSNENVTTRLAKMLSNIQVVTARVRMLGGRRRGKMDQASKNRFLLDTVTVYAQAVSVLQWADRRKETVNSRLTWEEMRASLLPMGLYGPNATGVAALIANASEEDDPEVIGDRQA